MRRVREILRLKHECRATDREIARSLSVARNTVVLTLERVTAGDLRWPLPATLLPAPDGALGGVKLLILDDWGVSSRLGPEQRHDMLEIVEDRYGRGVTLITAAAR